MSILRMIEDLGGGDGVDAHTPLRSTEAPYTLTEAPYTRTLTFNGSTLTLNGRVPPGGETTKKKLKRTNHKGHTLSNHIALALTHMLTPLAEHFPIWGNFNKLTSPHSPI